MTTEDQVDVFIQSEDPKHNGMYTVSSTTTVKDLHLKWTQEYLIPPESFVFLSSNEEIIDPKKSLKEFDLTFSGAQHRATLPLIAAAVCNVNVEIFGVENSAHRLQLRPSQRPDQLNPEIRAHFNICETDNFRLRTPSEPLDDCMSFEEQGVSEVTLLQVDMEYELTLHEAWSGVDDAFSVYASEQLALIIDAEEGQRLLLPGEGPPRKRQLNLESDVGTIIKKFFVDASSIFKLELQEERRIVFFSQTCYFQETKVWPSDHVNRTVNRYLTKNTQLILDDAIVCQESTWMELNLHSDALLHGDYIRVIILKMNGRRKCIRLPRLGCFQDLTTRVTNILKFPGPFTLLRKGLPVIAADDDLLSEVGVTDGAEFTVKPGGLTLMIKMGHKVVPWTTELSSVRFSNIVHELVAQTREPYWRFNKMTLCCRGCNRELTKQKEEYQAIPADCCELRSLQLYEPQPPKTAEFGTQVGPVSAHKRDRKIDVKPVTQSRLIQAAAYWHQVGCQTEPSEDYLPLYVINRTNFNQRRNFSSDMQPSVGDVRRWIASELGTNPEQLELWRFMGEDADGRECHLVCSLTGRNTGGDFVSRDGYFYKKPQLRRTQYVQEVDDEATFVSISGRRNIVRVDQA